MASEKSTAYIFQPTAGTKDFMDPAILDNLIFTTVEKPKPSAGTALVAIKAAALNYRDLLLVAHSPIYGYELTPRFSPTCDAAGVIEAVGPNSKWQVGDRVILAPNEGFEDQSEDEDAPWEPFVNGKSLGCANNNGCLRQYAAVRDGLLHKLPDHLSFEEGASLPGAAASAANALFGTHGFKLGPGTTVLTQGTGGVSCMAIQIAHACGATVIATSSSDEKLQVAKELGATHLINYRTHPNWKEEVLKNTGGVGVDLVVDVVGQAALEQSLGSLRQGGFLAAVGFLGLEPPKDFLFPLIWGEKTIRGVLGFHRSQFAKVLRIYTAQKIHPFVGKVFEWGDAKSAFVALKQQSVISKIIIRVDHHGQPV